MPRARSRLSLAVYIVVLLCAQFGALTHAAWHAYDGTHAHGHVAHDAGGAAHDDADGDAPYPASQADLCAFDKAFGQVLGGVHACAPLTYALWPGAAAIVDLPVSRLHAEALSPKSRGPPLFL